MSTQRQFPQAQIRADAELVTLIDVFTVDTAEQEHLVEAWQQATDEVMRGQPGFVSANRRR